MIVRKRPVWRILILAAENCAEVPLNCEECFAILEYLADVAIRGAEEEYLFEAVQRYLKYCPACHLKRLQLLEAEPAAKYR